ncbi:hypothetical protein MSAN_01629700 [Mycena sanguinolenta]|uniref:DUF6534 domain-containing protein n=1 Tax=Mycena sanguinolenta TaxID=230812 RepID=A0A8H6Y2D6_9AGAR|nr:hypothetical protein MSAN_01629700 [Mycena sanguinolenta]
MAQLSFHLPEYMASQETDLGPVFVDIFGPVWWGFCVSLVLAGVSILQGYLYFTRYNDKLSIRVVAGLMLALDFLSTALICQSVYYYILPHYGSLAPLGAVTNEIIVDCLISSAIAFISQMFFVYQLIVVKSKATAAPIMNALIVIFGVITLGKFIQLRCDCTLLIRGGWIGAGVGCAVVMFQHPRFIFMNRIHAFNILAGCHKAFGAAADVVATIAMFTFLRSADTGIRQTTSLLRFMMYLVVNRGLLVTLAQVVGLIVLFSSTNHLYWVGVHVNTTRLYSNTFFAILNSRTPPEPNHQLHINMRDGFSTMGQVSEFGSDDRGVKIHTTTTVSDT